MNKITRQLVLAATLSVAGIAVQASYAAEPVKAGPTSTISIPAQQTRTAAADQQQQQGLTRAQVIEDFKQYQRAHANPSYAELVFLR